MLNSFTKRRDRIVPISMAFLMASFVRLYPLAVRFIR